MGFAADFNMKNQSIVNTTVGERILISSVLLLFSFFLFRFTFSIYKNRPAQLTL